MGLPGGDPVAPGASGVVRRGCRDVVRAVEHGVCDGRGGRGRRGRVWTRPVVADIVPPLFDEELGLGGVARGNALGGARHVGISSARTVTVAAVTIGGFVRGGGGGEGRGKHHVHGR